MEVKFVVAISCPVGIMYFQSTMVTECITPYYAGWPRSHTHTHTHTHTPTHTHSRTHMHTHTQLQLELLE